MAVTQTIRNLRSYFDEFGYNNTQKLRSLASYDFLRYGTASSNYNTFKNSAPKSGLGTNFANYVSGQLSYLNNQMYWANNNGDVLGNMPIIKNNLSSLKTSLDLYVSQLNSVGSDKSQISKYLVQNGDLSGAISGISNISAKLNQYIAQQNPTSQSEARSYLKSIQNDSTLKDQFFNKLTFGLGTNISLTNSNTGDESFLGQYLPGWSLWATAADQSTSAVDFKSAQSGKTPQKQRQLIGNIIGDTILNAGFSSANRDSGFTRDARFDVNAESALFKSIGQKLYDQSGLFQTSTGLKKLGLALQTDVTSSKFQNAINSLLPNTGESAAAYKQRLGREIEVRTALSQLESTSPYLREATTARRTLKPPRTNETGQDDDQTKLGRIVATGVA